MRLTCRHLSAAVLAAVTAVWGSAGAAATLTLPDAIDRALRFAPAVDVASATTDMSRAHVTEQRAPLFPTLASGVEYYQAPGYNPTISNRGLSAALVTLDYTAWDWGRRQARLRAAEYVLEASRLGVAAARAQIVFDTTVAYFDLLRAHDAQKFLQGSLQRLERYVATIESLKNSGRAIASDVLKANTERASATLGAIIGQPNQGELDIAPITGIMAKPVGDVAQSAVIQAAHRAILSATSQIKVAKAERLPTFQLALTTGFLGIDPPKTVEHNGGASYDGVVSMPIFDGGLIRSHIDQAKAKEHSAIAQARQAEYLITRRIADASLRYDEAMRQLDILSRAQPIADDAFALTWTRFLGGGTATMLEVLDSYQTAEMLRLQRPDQEFAAREAVAETNLLYGHIQ